tara:strand:- start:258 stop:389 length:132 start_codon:yes stop_codon:yes gene_type:complete
MTDTIAVKIIKKDPKTSDVTNIFLLARVYRSLKLCTSMLIDFI